MSRARCSRHCICGLRGAPIDLIAKTVGMSKSGVSAYLASCHSRRPVYFKFDSSFRATVSHALEPQRDYWIGVKLDVMAPRKIEVIAKRSDVPLSATPA
jgi:hypothetical protein